MFSADTALHRVKVGEKEQKCTGLLKGRSYPDNGRPHISQLSMPGGLVNVQCLQLTGAAAVEEDPPRPVESKLLAPL